MKENKSVHTETNTTTNLHTNKELNTESREIMIENHHGKKIRYYRMAKQLSRNQVAELLGISSEEYAEIEKKKNIEDEMLKKMAVILNLGVEWLKEIPINAGIHNYYQDGNGSYYQNTGDAHHNTTINQPVDEVVKAYEKTIKQIEELYHKSLAEKNQFLAEIQKELAKEKEARENIVIKLLEKHQTNSESPHSS